jgi:DNA mismatch repair protein MutH
MPREPMRDAAVDAIVARAARLVGHDVRAVASALGMPIPGGGVGTKGRVGQLVERALGATGGSGAAAHDFPELGLELKTIPLDPRGRPHESTFVCAMRVDEEIDWDSSWVRAKLDRVLFVPVCGERRTPVPERVFGPPVLWSPSADELAQLRDDYVEIVGRLGLGDIEGVDARLGRALQLRPKAPNGTPTARAYGREGERIATVPRGFYLRASFTSRVLAEGALAPRPRASTSAP